MAKREFKWNDKSFSGKDYANGTEISVYAASDEKLANALRTFDITELPDFKEFAAFTETGRMVIVNGLKQKLADSAAIGKEKEPTVAEKLSAMDKVWENLKNGHWYAQERAGGVGKSTEDRAIEFIESMAAALTAQASSLPKVAKDAILASIPGIKYPVDKEGNPLEGAKTLEEWKKQKEEKAAAKAKEAGKEGEKEGEGEGEKEETPVSVPVPTPEKKQTQLKKGGKK